MMSKRVTTILPSSVFFYTSVLCFSFLVNKNLSAQDSLSNNIFTQQLWLDYNPSFERTSRVDFYGDIGFRTLVPYEWNRFIIRPSFRYKFPKALFKETEHNAELHGGIGFFYTYNLSESNNLEIRPFQGYKLIWPNRPVFQIKHYVRLEERFDIQTENWDNTFGLRFRYQARMEWHLTGKFIQFNKGVYLPAEIELFWNLIGARQFNDAIRVNLGVGYQMSPAWKWEFNLAYHFTRITEEEEFGSNDMVFRLRVFHRLIKE